MERIIMKTYTHIHLVLGIVSLFFLSACGGFIGGDVVKVTTVQKGTPYAGLKKEDVEKIEEIKEASRGKEIDPTLSNVIQKTQHFSVSEYLRQHPELKGSEGVDYRVGGYDVLNIIVYEEKDLSRESVRVSADGYISFPLIVRLKVDNLNTSEIEKLISNKLAEGKYLLDAHVSVMVTEYNSKRFMVLGPFKSPGSYALRAQERVLDAISRAGGFDLEQYKGGRSNKAMIIRTENPGSPQERRIVINLDLQGLLEGRDQISNIFLMNKDALFVPPAENFYIIGQVNKPGSYPIPEREITLVEAIGMAGGFTRIAARNRSRIIRVEEGVQKIIEVQVDAITEAGKKIQDVIIRANDVIVVPESFF